MTFGRHRIAAAAAVPLLVVGGCSEDPEPIIEPPAETTSVADPTPTPEAKEPWEEKSKAGAVAFAKHWFDAFGEAINSGRSADLRELSGKRCAACAAILRRIDSIESAGGFYESPGWRVLRVSKVERPASGEASMAVRVLQGAERFKESADSDVVRNPASRASYAVTLGWTDGFWQMTELRLLT